MLQNWGRRNLWQMEEGMDRRSPKLNLNFLLALMEGMYFSMYKKCMPTYLCYQFPVTCVFNITISKDIVVKHFNNDLKRLPVFLFVNNSSIWICQLNSIFKCQTSLAIEMSLKMESFLLSVSNEEKHLSIWCFENVCQSK